MPKPLRLVLLSCLMLFVELALIRWTASNVIFLPLPTLFTDLSAYPAGSRPPNIYDATFLLAIRALLRRSGAKA